jgi:hypothetical protein
MDTRLVFDVMGQPSLCFDACSGQQLVVAEFPDEQGVRGRLRLRAFSGDSVTPKGTVLLNLGSGGVRLLTPRGAVRCAFGTAMPPASSAEGDLDFVQQEVQTSPEHFDGSFVCVDAKGHVVDRADPWVGVDRGSLVGTAG